MISDLRTRQPLSQAPAATTSPGLTNFRLRHQPGDRTSHRLLPLRHSSRGSASGPAVQASWPQHLSLSAHAAGEGGGQEVIGPCLQRRGSFLLHTATAHGKQPVNPRSGPTFPTGQFSNVIRRPSGARNTPTACRDYTGNSSWVKDNFFGQY